MVKNHLSVNISSGKGKNPFQMKVLEIKLTKRIMKDPMSGFVSLENRRKLNAAIQIDIGIIHFPFEKKMKIIPIKNQNNLDLFFFIVCSFCFSTISFNRFVSVQSRNHFFI